MKFDTISTFCEPEEADGEEGMRQYGRSKDHREDLPQIVIDRAKVKADDRLDGRYLISTTDPTRSAEDVALGYKQLLEVERAFRMLKTTLELGPLHHRLPERIRARVLLCWHGLLLVRVAGNRNRDDLKPKS